VSFYDPAGPVRDARTVERYRFHDQGRLDEDEAMRYRACGFNLRKRGTPVFAWVRTREETEPAAIELCVCNGAAGGPPTLPERV
jgi:hypothetical protein